MSPWKWRLTGLGGGIGMIAVAGALTMTPVQYASSSVCFTTPAGCYCVDFFLTDVKEMVIEKAQDAVKEKINEQEYYKDYGAKEFSPDIGVGTVYRDTSEDEAYRGGFSESFAKRSGGMSAGAAKVEELDPTGETRVGKERIVARRANQSPEGMAPYETGREPDAEEVTGEAVAEWSDRMLLETEAVEIPEDKELYQLPMARLEHLYDQARYAIMSERSRHLMQEMGKSQKRIKSLEAARKALEGPYPVIGATETAQVHAQMLSTAIKAEQVESQLRREQAMALMVSVQDNDESGGRP